MDHFSSKLSKMDSSKYTSTNPSGNSRDSGNRMSSNRTSYQRRSFEDEEIIDAADADIKKQVTITFNPPRDSQSLEILKRESQKKGFSKKQDQTPSNCKGYSALLVNNQKVSQLQMIQAHLSQLNLKFHQNEGHGNMLKDNSQDIPLWLIARGNYS